MTRLLERLLALLPRARPATERDEKYLGGATDFCELERRLHELEARRRVA